MIKKLVIVASIFVIIFTLTACTNGGPETTPAPTSPAANEPATPSSEVHPKPRPEGAIEATWIEATVDTENQAVSIPISELEDNWNAHFKMETGDGEMNFMAYIFEGEVYVRANVCPPCRSVGFALDEAEQLLICDRCATLFDAETGSGIKGACVDYPKVGVPYQIANGQVLMQSSDLTAAYEETLLPG